MSQAFHIENFGCRAARADGEAVSDRLRSAGFTESVPETANVVVVNTCSVTAEADRAARAFIRRAHRLNPEARILVTGCYAQRAPEELASMPGVAAIVGNSHKALAPEIAIEMAGGCSSPRLDPASGFVPLNVLSSSQSGTSAPIWADDRFAHSFLEEAQLLPGEQTRPNLKIQEGCGNRCTFCVIPETRGPSRSLAADSILQKVRDFVAAGGNELVLSGINLGRWGKDLAVEPESDREGAEAGVHRDGDNKWTLDELVRVIVEGTDLPRLRLSSVEPMDWNTELIQLMRKYGGSRLARHAHLPLQSGSDSVLRRMHRRYRPWHYLEKAFALFDAAGGNLTLGADVMVGFPGETDGEFAETVEFIRSLPFGYLHLFPFSPRPGTRGWDLHAATPVASKIVEERMSVLRTLAAEKVRAHRSRFIGSVLNAITLHTAPALRSLGRTAALSENFVPIEVESVLPANQLVRIRMNAMTADMSLTGSLEQTFSDCPPMSPF